MRMPTTITAVAILTISALLGPNCMPQPAGAESTGLPPKNPYLYADSVLSIIHFDTAQTDAQPVENWRGTHRVQPKQVEFQPATVAIPGVVHRRYADGREVILHSTNAGVSKVRVDGGKLRLVDELLIPEQKRHFAPAAEVAKLLADMDAAYQQEDKFLPLFDAYMKKVGLGQEIAPNGLYTLIDRDGFLYAGYGTTLYKIGDSDQSGADAKLKIVAQKNVCDALPPELAKQVNRFLGVGMTYDGYLAVAMPGLIAVIDRDLTKVFPVAIPGEAVDNGIAIDPHGGIYVVTDKFMRKLVWNGKTLSSKEDDGAWKAWYDYAKEKPGLWLSRGSGSTPALMGFGPNEDHLVFIADAGNPVKLVAFWRDKIPADAKPVRGQDRRVAAAVPIDFDIKTTVEWSPQIYGNGVMVFASDFPDPVTNLADRNLFGTLVTMGYTRKSPRGADKMSWDKEKKSLTRDWTFKDRGMTWTLTPISTPGSAVYLNTLEDGLWKIIGLDWTTGKKVAEIELPKSFKFNCAGGFIFPLRDGNLFVGGMFGPVLVRKTP